MDSRFFALVKLPEIRELVVLPSFLTIYKLRLISNRSKSLEKTTSINFPGFD